VCRPPCNLVGSACCFSGIIMVLVQDNTDIQAKKYIYRNEKS